MRRVLLALACAIPAFALADTTPQPLPFAQDWSNAALLAVNNDWSGVPGIIGHRGDDITTGTGIDPQTLLADGTATPVNVSVNQANPNTNTGGGIAEFAITDPVVAFQGSGTADAPFLLLSLNTTGQSAIRVRYNLRDIDGSADNTNQQVALQYRIGNTGNFTNLPAGYVADASSGPSLATLVTPVDVTLPGDADNQALVQVRVITTNAAGSDEWIGVDDINVTGTSGGGAPFLSVADLTLAEGNAGTTTFNFAVTLSAAAPAGGVSFTASTADGTAVAPGDYAALAAVPFTIPAGMMSVNVPVDVVGDLVPEPNETFTLDLAGVTNANVQDGSATGTISNDDIPIVQIWEIQGNGVASPFVGQVVTTRFNVVTALAADGFFMQTADVNADADANTSNGIFVFTGVAPTVVVGNTVIVTGLVEESFGFTRIAGTPVVSVYSPTGTLPAVVPFNATRPSPNPAAPSCTVAGSPDVETSNFECFEGMLVQITGGTIGDGNQRFGSDPIAESRISAGPRPFREIGAVFPGLGGSIPVWDGNPEVFELDVNKLSNAFGNPLLTGGSTFNATGVIGYEFSDYEIWPTAFSIVSANVLPRPVAVPEANALAIGSINLLRFCNDQADPGPRGNCTPVLTAPEFQRRLAKTSNYIRTQLRAPAVVGMVEIENLATLQALATQISTDGGPTYTAFLEEGNDVGGIDVGFLVQVGPSQVTSPTVTQLDQARTGTGTTCSGGPGTCLLHDRPPLLLRGTWGPTGRPFAVMVNHTRSLLGIEDEMGEGPRIRAKRLEQAQAIAEQVQSFQTANPAVPLVLVGDYNAFQFTDGYVDVIGVIRGTEVDAQNLVPNPVANISPSLADAVVLANLPAAERYSYTFGGSAQIIDHALLSQAAVTEFLGFSYTRGNSDAAVDLFNAMDSTPIRVSDHEGFVLRLRMLGADVAPMVAYNPAAGGTVAFTGVTTIGSTGTGSIAVTASGGSGVPGAATTTTVAGCVISGANAASFAGFTQTLSFVAANPPTSGTLSGTCTAQAAAVSATLTCQETRGGAAAVPRTFTLSCPLGAPLPAAPTVTYNPSGTSVNFSGQGLLGSTASGSITVTAANGVGPASAATTTTVGNCVISNVNNGGSFSGFNQTLSFVANNPPLTGTLSGTCVAQDRVLSGELTCQETRGTAAPVARLFTLICPIALPTPLLAGVPPFGSVVDFGTVVRGESSFRSITLDNPGTGTTLVSGCQVTGAGFTLDTLPAAEIPARGGTTFRVQWRALSVGPVAGTLTCNTNVAGLPTISWPLNGTGVLPIVSQIPATDDLGRLLLLAGLAGLGLVVLRRRG